METAPAPTERHRVRLVTRTTALRGAEVAAGVVFTLLFFQEFLQFSLFDPYLWAIYGPIFLAGLNGTVRYILRAGFQSVPKGQLEAAQALGMRSWQAMRFVVLPQTFRLSLPPLGNELAVVIKDTSLLAAVAGGEIVSRSQNFAGTLSIFGYPVEWLFAIWTAVAIAYFVATFSVTRILLVLERRFHTPRLEAVSI